MALISQYHKVANDLINSLETIQSTIWAVMTWQLRRNIEHGRRSTLQIDELDELDNIYHKTHFALARMMECYHSSRGPYEWDFEACHTVHHLLETSCLEYQEVGKWMTKLETACKAAETFASEEVRRLQADEAPF